MQLPTFYNINITQWLILLTIIVWIGYDFVVRVLFGNGATISVNIRLACYNNPEWAFAIGLLVGHLLFSIGSYSR